MKKTILALGLLGAFTAQADVSILGAGDLYVDVGTNAYDSSSTGANDADSLTGLFDNFAFSTLRATSFYDVAPDGSLAGGFEDTNDLSQLSSYGINSNDPGAPDLFSTADPTDGAATVGLRQPTSSGESWVTQLAPITQTSGGGLGGNQLDDEGYGSSWIFDIEFELFGTIASGTPDYTGGTFKLFFENGNPADRFQFLSADFYSDSVALVGNAAAVSIDFQITDVVDNMLYRQTGVSTSEDMHDVINDPNATPTVLRVGFAVNPPIPTLASLGTVSNGQDVKYARQSNLSGTAINPVPEPSSLAMFALGLLGLAGAARRKA